MLQVELDNEKTRSEVSRLKNTKLIKEYKDSMLHWKNEVRIFLIIILLQHLID